MKRKVWTEKEINILRANAGKLTHKEIARLLPGRTVSMVKSATTRFGIYSDRFRFSAEDIEFLKENYARVLNKELAKEIGCSIHSIENKAFNLGLKKDKKFLAEHFRKKMTDDHPARKTQFKKGHKPFNKGRSMPTVGRMAETQFKKGHKPPNTLQVGEESLIDGYVKVKVAEPNKWKWKHRLIWEEHHGKIPKGFAVAFKDGNRKNFDLSNLELISREELMHRNTIHNFPVELKETIQTLGGLKRRINKIKEKQNA